MNVTFDIYKWMNTKKWMNIIIQKEKNLEIYNNPETQYI